MALRFPRKASKPQAQAPPPPPPAPAAPAWSLPPDWREQLTATKPKGRFKYGENIPGGPRR
ncbi:MAG: hypothetical protein QOE44_1023 [Solirubrobacteraceae bacterium]|jgi:hypothetical protein|nr:hypothetical protein [Solirubrobacteraceae bacterium]